MFPRSVHNIHVKSSNVAGGSGGRAACRKFEKEFVTQAGAEQFWKESGSTLPSPPFPLAGPLAPTVKPPTMLAMADENNKLNYSNATHVLTVTYYGKEMLCWGQSVYVRKLATLITLHEIKHWNSPAEDFKSGISLSIRVGCGNYPGSGCPCMAKVEDRASQGAGSPWGLQSQGNAPVWSSAPRSHAGLYLRFLAGQWGWSRLGAPALPLGSPSSSVLALFSFWVCAYQCKGRFCTDIDRLLYTVQRHIRVTQPLWGPRSIKQRITTFGGRDAGAETNSGL